MEQDTDKQIMEQQRGKITELEQELEEMEQQRDVQEGFKNSAHEEIGALRAIIEPASKLLDNAKFDRLMDLTALPQRIQKLIGTLEQKDKDMGELCESHLKMHCDQCVFKTHAPKDYPSVVRERDSLVAAKTILVEELASTEKERDNWMQNAQALSLQLSKEDEMHKENIGLKKALKNLCDYVAENAPEDILCKIVKMYGGKDALREGCSHIVVERCSECILEALEPKVEKEDANKQKDGIHKETKENSETETT